MLIATLISKNFNKRLKISSKLEHQRRFLDTRTVAHPAIVIFELIFRGSGNRYHILSLSLVKH